MNYEATREIVRALSESRLSRSHSALYLQPRKPTAPKINQSWKEVVTSLVEQGKIHILNEHTARLENKRRLLGY